MALTAQQILDRIREEVESAKKRETIADGQRSYYQAAMNQEIGLFLEYLLGEFERVGQPAQETDK